MSLELDEPFELFFELFFEELEDELPESSEEPLLPLPEDPLMPDEDEPLLSAPLLEDPPMPLPLELEPERSELVELLPDVPELPELEPDAPADMMSSFFTLRVSPEPEKLARTWSPSLTSFREARLPSFITWVLESSFSVLSLPDSVSVLFDRSKLWMRPCSVWPLDSPELDAELLLSLLLLGELLLDEVESCELPVEEPLWPIVLDEPLLDGLPSDPLLESRVEPLEPALLLPLESLLPVLLELCARALLATRTMLAMARPRPHCIFFISSPFSVLREPGTSPALFAVWLHKR